LCHDTLAIPSPDPQVVQELHLVTSHLLCEYVDQALPLVRDLPRVPGPRTERFVDGRPFVTAGLPDGSGRNGHGSNGHGPARTGGES
ncbi:phosphoheptose isomerase, partial [Micromonospora sp. NPDC126480]